MEKNQYAKFFVWAFALGKKLREEDPKYGEILIFDLREEQTPGRFFNKLALRLADFNKRLGLNVTMNQDIITQKLRGDSFYYLKASILAGLINSVYSNTRENE